MAPGGSFLYYLCITLRALVCKCAAGARDLSLSSLALIQASFFPVVARIGRLLALSCLDKDEAKPAGWTLFCAAVPPGCRVVLIYPVYEICEQICNLPKCFSDDGYSLRFRGELHRLARSMIASD